MIVCFYRISDVILAILHCLPPDNGARPGPRDDATVSVTTLVDSKIHHQILSTKYFRGAANH
jgi:hypothetical protein